MEVSHPSLSLIYFERLNRRKAGNGAYPFDQLRARPEFYRKNERKSEPLMVIPRQGSELKAVEEACREASRTVEPLNGLNVWNGLQHSLAANSDR